MVGGVGAAEELLLEFPIKLFFLDIFIFSKNNYFSVESSKGKVSHRFSHLGNA